MGKDSYIFYIDWIDVLLSLPDGLRLKVYDSIMKYMRDREQPCDSEVLYSPFGLIQRQIDRDEKKYKEKCAKRSEAGKKGNNVRWSQKQQSIAKIANAIIDSQKSQPLANIADNDNDNDNDNENENENVNDKFSLSENLVVVDDNKGNEKQKTKQEIEDELTAELLSEKESAYWEQTAMGLYIREMGWDVPGIRRMLPPFQEGNKAKGVSHRDINDLKSHFYDWLKIQADHRRRELNKQEQTNKGPLDDYIAKRLG